MLYKHFLKPILFQFDAEKAHETAFSIGNRMCTSDVALTFMKDWFSVADASLEVHAAGLRFPNPVGLAAGFDKNALLLPLLEHIGFGFVEIGSITAKPSSGNPRPRMFRLPKDDALINRMGLNNDGADVITKRLAQRKSTIPIGVNIAKTPKSGLSGAQAVQDYVTSYTLAIPVADYITINISCPNTGDGKSFEDPDSFSELISALRNTPESTSKPLFIKFSSDTPPVTLKMLIQISEEYHVDGYVAVNTSTKRDGLKTSSKLLYEMGNGGLSGKPVASNALEKLDALRQLIGGQKPIISVGGIMTPDDAFKRLEAGATLIQLYTGLVYNGPSFPGKINRHLIEQLKS